MGQRPTKRGYKAGCEAAPHKERLQKRLKRGLYKEERRGEERRGEERRGERLATSDAFVGEAEFAEFFGGVDIASVDEDGLAHDAAHLFKIGIAEGEPFGD